MLILKIKMSLDNTIIGAGWDLSRRNKQLEVISEPHFRGPDSKGAVL